MIFTSVFNKISIHRASILKTKRGWVGLPFWLLLVACRSSAKITPTAAAVASSVAATPTLPADRLEEPGELAAGSEEAFGMPLPRRFRTQRFEQIVFARGDATGDQVIAFVRRRVSDTAIELRASRTIFPRVTLRGQSDSRVLRVEVREEKGRETELLIRDLTPAPAGSAGTSEDERWRRTGLTPQGRLVDPNRTF